jgi:hypothetical protein
MLFLIINFQLQNNEMPSLKPPRLAKKRSKQEVTDGEASKATVGSLLSRIDKSFKRFRGKTSWKLFFGRNCTTDIPAFLPKKSSYLREEEGGRGLEDSDVSPSSNGTTEPMNTVRREEFPSFDINDEDSSSDNNNDDDISTGEENGELSTSRRPSTSQSTTAANQKEKRHTSMSADSTDTHTSTQSDRSLLNLAEEYSKQGKELYAEGQYDRALEAYDTCLKFAPKTWLARATILGNRAAVNFMLGR